MRRLFCLLAALVLLAGCSSRKTEEEAVPSWDSLYVPEAPPKEESPEAAPEPPEPPEDPAEFVRVADYIPDILVDLRYAGTNNFTGQAVYDFSDAYLRYGTVEKLAAAQSALAEEGLGLKIWDAFRPAPAQFQLWEAFPDTRYVADPNRGFSAHSRGGTVDVTLVDQSGRDIPMPSDFDEFSSKANRDYNDAAREAAEYAQRLEEVMTAAGFSPYYQEWWHYSDTDRYEVDEKFQPPADETGGTIDG